MSYTLIDLKVDDQAIATITFNRPDKRNAMSDDMRSEFIHALEHVAATKAIKALVVTGAGKGFCAGGDISGMQKRMNAPAGEVGFNGWHRQQRVHHTQVLLHTMPKPVIAAVNGAASGLGADTAMACDFVIASEWASFAWSYVLRGIIPDGGGMYFLPRRVGLVRAKELIFTGRQVKVDEAVALGIVDRKTSAETLPADAQAWAVELSRASSTALALTKTILNQSFELSSHDVFAQGSQAQGICYTSSEHRASVEAFLAKSAAKEVNAVDLTNAISRLIQPRSVAVIGASADPSKTAGRPVAYLQKHGFAGAIYPVNPKADAIGDLKCYPDIASLPETPDVAIVLLGAGRAHLAVRDLSAQGCSAAIVLASGYTETGEDGARRQKQLVEAAGSMRILGPNTIGLVNLTDAIVLSATGALEMDEFPVGGIGVVSQSGGILGSLLSRAAARGIGLSKLISTSNEVDLELADFIDHLADDPATKVIALYIETVRNPAKFRAACLKAARAGKPVVAFKIGRSEAGAKAAVSHTGAMAGADRMYDALFKQVGVIRANSFSDLLDVPAALATGRRLHGNRVAILTSTGGAGTLVSDDLGVAGFETPAPDAATADALRALQTGSEAVLDRNPIDVTLAGLRPDLLRGAIRALLASPSYDALVIIVGSSSLAQPELMAGAIQDCLPETDKPVFAYVSPHAPDVGALLTRRGVPAFAAAESCTAALDGMLRVSRFTATAECDSGAVAAPMTQVPESLKGSLDEAQAKQLFSSFGVPCAAERIVSRPAEAEAAARELGGRVVLKILSSQITHKSDVGGVAVGLTPQTVGERLQQMTSDVLAMAGVRPERFLVQEMVGGGTELILGMHRDGLGTAIMLGMGGVTAELFKDTTMRLLPTTGGLSRADALAMAQELKTWPLLDGFRGRPKADVETLVDAIVAFSNMAAHLGTRLVEAEINPVFVLPRGQGVRAADGVAVLA